MLNANANQESCYRKLIQGLDAQRKVLSNLPRGRVYNWYTDNGKSNGYHKCAVGNIARDSEEHLSFFFLARRKILCKRFSTKSRISQEQLSSRLPWPLNDRLSGRLAGMRAAGSVNAGQPAVKY